jgi:hypothetical protein
MTWAQGLKPVFKVDIERCSACGGTARIIACIEDPAVIEKILTYLKEKATSAKPVQWRESRVPLGARLFD